MTDEDKKRRLAIIRAIAYRRQTLKQTGPLRANGSKRRCECGMTFSREESYLKHLQFDHKEDWQRYQYEHSNMGLSNRLQHMAHKPGPVRAR